MLMLRKSRGFTLIEIVLALALMGMLIVLVFISVYGAQKSRRDTQRKVDNNRLMAQVEACASNHLGTFTVGSPACDVGSNYIPGGTYAPNSFNDPDGGAYQINVGGLIPCDNNPGTIYLNFNGAIVTSRMCLEQGQFDATNR
jgi:prepilin-type N-terminal cleavage/methylation domain-containing protein